MSVLLTSQKRYQHIPNVVFVLKKKSSDRYVFKNAHKFVHETVKNPTFAHSFKVVKYFQQVDLSTDISKPVVALHPFHI